MKSLQVLKNETLLRALLFCLGATALIVGAYRGEAGTVMKKAVHICLECIGIG